MATETPIPEAVTVPTSLMLENAGRVEAVVHLANELACSIDRDPVSLEQLKAWSAAAWRIEELTGNAVAELINQGFGLADCDDYSFLNHPVNVELWRQRDIFRAGGED
jgi:hypothetical protein